MRCGDCFFFQFFPQIYETLDLLKRLDIGQLRTRVLIQATLVLFQLYAWL